MSEFKIRHPPSLIDLLVPISVHHRLTIRTKSAGDWETGRAPSWRERARLMFTAKQYRAKAAEYTELLKAASLPAEIREFRRLERSYLTLAENEEWMADNLEKINHPGADENWYGDAIIAHQGEGYGRMPWGRRRDAVG